VITALKRHVAVVLMLVCNAACTALLSLSRPDHVVFNVDSDDLLTPGADDDLTSPLPGQEHQALLNNTLDGLVVPSCLHYDIPGYTPADRNSQSCHVLLLLFFSSIIFQ